MTNIIIIYGDLLESDCDILVHQLNCITVKSFGLSKQIADKYTYADVYSKRRPVNKYKNVAIKEDWGIPGTIVIRNSKGLPTIVGLYGQFSPSKPNKYHKHLTKGKDTYESREKWFEQGLQKLLVYIEDHKESFKKIGFPYKIGCGLASGNWINYKKMIYDFANQVDKISKDITIIIYKK